MQDLEKQIIDTIIKFNQFPDINQLLIDGLIRKKGAWYEILDAAALDILGPWVRELCTGIVGISNPKVKLTKPGKRHQKLYEIIKKKYPNEFKRQGL